MQIPKKLHVTAFLFSFFTSLATVATVSAAAELPAVVAHALQAAAIGPEAVGIYVQQADAASGFNTNSNITNINRKPLAAANASQAFLPASTMKLLTTDAALELLGPTFAWKTEAYVDGSQSGDVLQGDLIFKGSGDPTLVLEKFWLFLRQLRAAGIRDIRGNLVLDRSVFEESFHDAGSFDDEPLKPYNVGPDALLLNYKTFGFHFMPDTANGVVRVSIEPPLAGYPVAAPRLGSGSCDDWHARLQPTVEVAKASFGGAFPASCGDKTWYLNPYQMSATQYFGAVFRQLWGELGGSLTGEVKSGVVPPSARLAGVWQSATLPEVIRDINKYSNNVMARQLLLTMAADILKLPANPERGARAVKTWLAAKGIDAGELVIENGSGLSRRERISPLTMGRMLVAAAQSPLMPEFISSMPLVGYDGTMRRRLTAQGVAGNAHIKTGSLNEVRALAGYVLAASGKRYAVVFFINHPNAAQGQKAQDALLQWVYEKG
jgi:serine-type D-Ala-D-Ala carboxypeptidase/endopeptidase (penicillin-binding protein 4)